VTSAFVAPSGQGQYRNSHWRRCPSCGFTTHSSAPAVRLFVPRQFWRKEILFPRHY